MRLDSNLASFVFFSTGVIDGTEYLGHLYCIPTQCMHLIIQIAWLYVVSVTFGMLHNHLILQVS